MPRSKPLALAAFSIAFALVLAAFTLRSGVAAQAQRSGCLIVSVADLAFGGYDALSSTPLDSTAFLSFRCDRLAPSTSLRIELERGGGSSFSPRNMTNQGKRLAYDLFLDSARTLIWGDGTRGTAAYQAQPVNGFEVTVPIYGRIRPRQAVTPGHYSDRIRVTIIY